MDYFKHYATASDSKSLNIIFDKFGHKGIAFWWMLVELCCDNWDGHSEPEFEFHSRTVVTKLKSSVRSVKPWLELCSDLGMCAFAHNSTKYSISIPNLMKIKTSRNVIKSNKKQLSVYIEENRIDKNRIDKNRKEESSARPCRAKPINYNYFSDTWNQTVGPMMPKVQALSPKRKTNIRTLIKSCPDLDFKNYVEKITTVKFLCGVNDRGWVAGFDWAINFSNYLKVIEGKYQSAKPVEQITEDDLGDF